MRRPSVPQPSVQKLPSKPRRGNGLPKQKRSNVLLPAGWPRPKGYANGIKAKGEMVFVGGMVGWDANERFPDGFVAQVRQALENIAAVLAAGGAKPQHVTRLTWYVLDIEEYRAVRKELGAAYRAVMG